MRLTLASVLAALILVFTLRPAAYIQPAATATRPNAHFTFDGKPIQPAIVSLFNIDIADNDRRGPRVATVNLDACVQSNWYPGPAKRNRAGWFTYRFGHKNGGEYFAYRCIGKTPTGTWVIETVWSGGGSGIFETIMLLRFGSFSYYAENHHTSALRNPAAMPTLTCIGQITMGDRDPAAIAIHGNHLTLGKSQYRKKPVTLLLP